MGCLQRVHDVLLRDKVPSCEIRKALNDEWFSSKSRDPSYFDSAICSECPKNDWRNMFYSLNPRESGPDVIQGPNGVTTSPTLLDPTLVWSQQNYVRLLLTA